MLGAGRHDKFLGAIKRLELKLGTESRLCVADVELANEVVALAPKDGVGTHAKVHIEVARGSVARTHRAPSVEAEGGAGVDARGHIDLVRLLLDHTTFAPTTRTRRRDHLTETATTGAGARGHHLT